MSRDTEFQRSLSEHGWVTNQVPGAPSYADLDSFLAKQAGVRRIGHPLLLEPIEANLARPGTLSAKYGFTAQPLHTDCANWPVPPRFLCLYGYRVQGTSVETHLFQPDFRALDSIINSLVSRIWTFQAPGFNGFYSRSVERKLGHFSIRFDLNVMHPLDLATELAKIIEQYGERSTIVIGQGEWILIDNWRCLHARGQVGPESLKRKIERTYWGYRDGMEI